MRALKEIPCPRFCELDGHILDAASDAFAALSECALLPAGRSYEDPVRREIDVAVCSMMGLPGGALAEMDSMRSIFCREPTVGGRAGAAGQIRPCAKTLPTVRYGPSCPCAPLDGPGYGPCAGMGFSGQIQRHPSQAGLFDFAVCSTAGISVCYGCSLPCNGLHDPKRLSASCHTKMIAG